jgi:hypothetical protein
MNRRRTTQRSSQLVAILAACAAMLLAGCSTASPTVPPSDRQPAASASTGPTAASTARPSPTASPSTSASPLQPALLPTGWQSCTNAHEGFEIGYPGGWYTASLNPEQACRQFHPTRFTVPVGGEYTLTALNAVQTPEVFDPSRSGMRDPSVRTMLREEMTVGGRRAVRFEEALIEAGFYPLGTMKYGYVIDRDGREFAVFTMAVPAETRYTDWKPVVDLAVETLRFE